MIIAIPKKAKIPAIRLEDVLCAMDCWQDCARKNGVREKEMKLFASLFKRIAEALRKVFAI